MVTYVTATDIWLWSRVANPNLALTDIPDSVVAYANRRVRMELAQHQILGDQSGHEDAELLTMAGILYGTEALSNLGKVFWRNGDLASIDDGLFKTQLQQTHPMFFFAQGDSKRFHNLIPHETWLQAGHSMIQGFIASYYQRRDSWSPEIVHDDWARGYGAADIDEHWRQ